MEMAKGPIDWRGSVMVFFYMLLCHSLPTLSSAGGSVDPAAPKLGELMSECGFNYSAETWRDGMNFQSTGAVSLSLPTKAFHLEGDVVRSQTLDLRFHVRFLALAAGDAEARRLYLRVSNNQGEEGCSNYSYPDELDEAHKQTMQSSAKQGTKLLSFVNKTSLKISSSPQGEALVDVTCNLFSAPLPRKRDIYLWFNVETQQLVQIEVWRGSVRLRRVLVRDWHSLEQARSMTTFDSTWLCDQKMQLLTGLQLPVNVGPANRSMQLQEALYALQELDKDFAALEILATLGDIGVTIEEEPEQPIPSKPGMMAFRFSLQHCSDECVGMFIADGKNKAAWFGYISFKFGLQFAVKAVSGSLKIAVSEIVKGERAEPAKSICVELPAPTPQDYWPTALTSQFLRMSVRNDSACSLWNYSDQQASTMVWYDPADAQVVFMDLKPSSSLNTMGLDIYVQHGSWGVLEKEPELNMSMCGPISSDATAETKAWTFYNQSSRDAAKDAGRHPVFGQLTAFALSMATVNGLDFGVFEALSKLSWIANDKYAYYYAHYATSDVYYNADVTTSVGSSGYYDVETTKMVTTGYYSSTPVNIVDIGKTTTEASTTYYGGSTVKDGTSGGYYATTISSGNIGMTTAKESTTAYGGYTGGSTYGGDTTAPGQTTTNAETTYYAGYSTGKAGVSVTTTYAGSYSDHSDYYSQQEYYHNYYYLASVGILNASLLAHSFHFTSSGTGMAGTGMAGAVTVSFDQSFTMATLAAHAVSTDPTIKTWLVVKALPTTEGLQVLTRTVVGGFESCWEGTIPVALNISNTFSRCDRIGPTDDYNYGHKTLAYTCDWGRSGSSMTFSVSSKGELLSMLLRNDDHKSEVIVEKWMPSWSDIEGLDLATVDDTTGIPSSFKQPCLTANQQDLISVASWPLVHMLGSLRTPTPKQS